MNNVVFEESKIVEVKNGQVSFTQDLDDIITYYELIKTIASDNVNNLRTSILDAMKKYDIYTASLPEHTLSLVFHKDIETFNSEEFIKNEAKSLVDAFSEKEDIEEFNLELFKIENPELYNKYIIKKTNYIIDEKKLSKVLKSVYDKYVVITKVDKEPYLRITKNKEK